MNYITVSLTARYER